MWRRTRPGQRQGCPLPANVCQLHIVHYYEVIEMAHQGGDLVNTRIEQQIGGAAVDVAVALNASLDAEQKAVIPLSFGERLHRVRYHAIEPAQAVAAGNQNLPPPAQVADPGGVQKGIELPRETIKNARSERTAMQARQRLRSQVRRLAAWGQLLGQRAMRSSDRWFMAESTIKL